MLDISQLVIPAQQKATSAGVDAYQSHLSSYIAQQLKKSDNSLLKWLLERGITQAKVNKFPGMTNHVFCIQQTENESLPSRFVARFPDPDVDHNLAPLSNNFDEVIGFHHQAAQLGIAPRVLGIDSDRRLMFIRFAGSAKSIRRMHMIEINEIVKCLQSADAMWAKVRPAPQAHTLEWTLLPYLIEDAEPDATDQNRIAERAALLLEIANRYGISELPLVPSHSDWNPGNWLHNGHQWRLIDWDFSGWRPALWDWAGMVVEHEWTVDEVSERLAVIDVDNQDLLPWFCCCLCLINLDWYQVRFDPNSLTTMSLLIGAQEKTRYWFDELDRRLS